MFLFMYIKLVFNNFSDCPQISVGSGAIASSRERTFGAKVKYMCPTGQEFSSGVTEIEIECMQSGQWSVSHIPRCQGNPYLFIYFSYIEKKILSSKKYYKKKKKKKSLDFLKLHFY